MALYFQKSTYTNLGEELGAISPGVHESGPSKGAPWKAISVLPLLCHMVQGLTFFPQIDVP